MYNSAEEEHQTEKLAKVHTQKKNTHSHQQTHTNTTAERM